ncbi:MAG: Holliday junction resolvase RuvX [Thermodesulfobacteriota bacterium]
MSEPDPGVILALDVGERRIGLAVSDPQGLTARPLAVLARRGRDADVAELGRIAAAQGASRLVLGLPRRLDGGLGPAAQRILSLGRRLERRLGLPVEFVDEALSTVEAQEVLLAADLSRSRRKQVVDQAAAAVILRRYLAGNKERA